MNLDLQIRENKKEVGNSIETFNRPLAKFLEYNGLPIENILMPIEERIKVINSMQNILELVDGEKRVKAYYLSKFTISIASGLFDGALNYVWNEAVRALRTLVINYDLQYFYSIAAGISNKYKSLSKEEELEFVSEHDLLEINRRIGLLSDINFKKLEYINYMRNHSSAAHPNENEISGYEMISMLENIIRYAVNAKPDHSMIELKTLNDNIRKTSIPTEDLRSIINNLAKHPQERIDDFMLSIFGLYCDERQSSLVRSNIELISPKVWKIISEDIKHRIGAKFGYYRVNVEEAKKNLCAKFLRVVEGESYKDEDSLAVDLIELLQELRSVHFNYFNFYNEYPYAQRISKLLENLTSIPKAAERMFIKIISICYVGNGKGYKDGVDEIAVSYYEKFIRKFTDENIKEFLRLFDDTEFTLDLDKDKADKRMKKLTLMLEENVQDIRVKKALEKIRKFADKKLSLIHKDSDFKSLIKL